MCSMVLLYVHAFYLSNLTWYCNATKKFLQNAQTLGLPFRECHQYIMELFIVPVLKNYKQLKPITDVVNPFLLKIMGNFSANNAGEELCHEEMLIFNHGN